MIVNVYAVLDAFTCVLRLGLGIAVLALGFFAARAWFRLGRDESAEQREPLEDRCYLLFMMAGLLLWLNVASWPLLYLLLQSYVPEWPGITCIYGVTQIGAGSIGVSRYLPRLLAALQAMKPVLVFLSGAWFVLHLVNRRTRRAPLTGRVLLVLLAAALLATVDAAAEAAYLIIPKKEEFPSAGCCTTAATGEADPNRYLPRALTETHHVAWLYAIYYAVNLGMAAVLTNGLWRQGRELPPVRAALLTLAALATLAVNAVFLTDAAAPRLLHLPYHHCPYDLIAQAPGSVGAVALFLGGCLCVLWASVLVWLGRHPESRPFLAGTVSRLLLIGLLGYLTSLLLMSAELVLA
jgi:hypothetical protein